jgi:protein TonB
MFDKYVEKSLLYLVALSVLVHVAVFAIIWYMPDEKPTVKQEPYFVELEDLPQMTDLADREKKKTKRKSETKFRVEKETSPKGEMPKERTVQVPRRAPRQLAQEPLQSQRKGMERSLPQSESSGNVVKKAPRGGDLLKNSKNSLPEIARLYPSANRLAGLEENYRKKYGPEVEEGETKFLNTDDILFGSFLRRFETAVYGVWRYPPDAARLGIEGVTPVKITFNKKGEVENVELLESSGSKILDNEVFRTLRMIGPIGAFPKGYGKDKFNLIAFFQYGIVRGMSRGMLH